jgi:hypothetical protein
MTTSFGREGSEQSSAIQIKMVCAGEDQRKQCELISGHANRLSGNGRDHLRSDVYACKNMIHLDEVRLDKVDGVESMR